MAKQLYDLKIDTELRDLLPPLLPEELEQLEKNIITNGCELPLFTWHGYIADGHNRYGICKKNNISFEVITLAFEEKSDVMRWMIDGQLGRRNLTPVQRIAVAKKYENKLKEKAKENQATSTGGSSPQLISNWNEAEKSPIIVSKEIARLANVGTGTLARYDVVMKSDDEETKGKMLKEEVSINKAYDTVKQKQPKIEKITTQPPISDRPKIKICTKCGTEKPVIDFFGNDNICKDCKRKSEDNIPQQTQGGGAFKDAATGESIKSSVVGIDNDIMVEIKTAKNASDYIVPEHEIYWLKELLDDTVDQINNKFFVLLKAIDKMSNTDIDEIINIIETSQNQLSGLKNKFKNNEKENN